MSDTPRTDAEKERDQLRAELETTKALFALTKNDHDTILQLRAQLAAAEECVEVLRNKVRIGSVCDCPNCHATPAIAAYDAIKKGQQ